MVLASEISWPMRPNSQGLSSVDVRWLKTVAMSVWFTMRDEMGIQPRWGTRSGHSPAKTAKMQIHDRPAGQLTST